MNGEQLVTAARVPGYPARWPFDRLTDRFSAGRVLKDIDSVEPGDGFAVPITAAAGSCAVLLAVITRSWLAHPGDADRRRLDDPLTRRALEIETASASRPE